MADPEFQAVLIGGPSNGTHMVLAFPIREVTIPTITAQGAFTESYQLIGQSPGGRCVYEHQPRPALTEASNDTGNHSST